jgi:hypothetical protein
LRNLRVAERQLQIGGDEVQLHIKEEEEEEDRNKKRPIHGQMEHTRWASL